jgi:hypothetical protein
VHGLVEREDGLRTSRSPLDLLGDRDLFLAREERHAPISWVHPDRIGGLARRALGGLLRRLLGASRLRPPSDSSASGSRLPGDISTSMSISPSIETT